MVAPEDVQRVWARMPERARLIDKLVEPVMTATWEHPESGTVHVCFADLWDVGAAAVRFSVHATPEQCDRLLVVMAELKRIHDEMVAGLC